MQSIDDVLRRNDGYLPVQVELAIGDERHVFASRTRKVEWGPGLQEELAQVIGKAGGCELVEPERPEETSDDGLLAVA